MGFLGDLAGAISSQFGVGENNNRTLDTVINGQDVKYGQLGDFASQIDQSAQRKYTGQGYLRLDPYNAEPKQMEVLFQEPNATVFIKKSMFSSVAENYRSDFMDQDEKLYYRALKTLFLNKCNVISALEKLSKIQQVTNSVGSISDQLLPIIFTLSDTISSGGLSSSQNNLFGGAGGGSFSGNSDASALSSVMNQLRKIYAFNTTSPVTTWITDDTDLFQSQIGKGTGVIEITNFSRLNTTVSVDGIKNPGSFSLTIQDPYEAMLITDWDIEKAIADATNMWSSHSLFNFSQQSIQQTIADNLSQLNQFRSSRGASSITINVNPDTLLGRRVIAIIDRLGIELVFDFNSGFLGVGSSASVSPEYLKGGAIAGNDGLDTANGVDSSGIRHNVSELSVFSNLISSVYSQIQLDQNSRNAFQVTNKNTNYARKKLRNFFSGQLIIQPMDTVHIYISTKSRYDTKLLSGLQSMFSGVGILQNLNNTVTNITNAVNTLFNPSGGVDMQAEKSVYVGSDFPNYLWSVLRSQFANENEGTHVFAGLVDRADDSWREGQFVIDVSGRDNIAYFEQGKINFKPGVDNFIGNIYDPLTPFKSNFDTITSNAKDNTPQLLDENIVILGTSQDKKGILKAKAGPMAGQKVTSDSIFHGTIINKNTNQASQEIFAPDGLVYKWKEGIGVFVQFGNSLELNDPNRVGQPNIANEPFAGQDIMNVISLLVTGQPYNYANFWRASSSLNGFSNDPQSGQNAAFSYISSLKNDLTKSNLLWGNFIPFKNLVIDEQSYALAMQAQFRSVQHNSDLDNKLQQLKNLNNQAAMLGAVNIFAGPPNNSFQPQFKELQAQLNNLQNSIASDIANIQIDDANFKQLAAASGPDATFDYSDFVDSSKVSTAPSDPNPRRALRKKLNYLTRRMSYDVRANTDKNLFIVDDFYDKDYDLIAYTQGLTDGIKLYNNDFTSVREKIMAAAELFNLEVFADTQGHIRVRPPQYNRMPSSVFYKMMYLKQAYGIQIFPQFLADIFGDQISTLKTRLEIIEDMIRLDCAVLGQTDDLSASSFIVTNGAAAGSGAAFGFISDSTGLITDIGSVAKVVNSNDDQVQSFLETLQSNFTTNSLFNNSQKYSFIVSSLKSSSQAQNGINTNNITSVLQGTYIQNIIDRIKTKSGNSIVLSKLDYVTNNSAGFKDVVTGPQAATIDIFKTTKELQEQLRERQKVIKLLYSAIKNASEFKSLDSQSSNTSNQLLAPAIFGNSNVPEVYEHMIEDETYDDYGLNSGTRFIIKRAQIKDLRVSVGSPEYTMVEVQGVFNTFAPNDLPPELNSFPNNGNGLVTATAVDYDSWRRFGLKNVATVKVPFLSSPDSQCGPYASMLLSRNRKNIITASCTIVGNEFMQPGEVVYLQDRQMLFYVNGVSHNFGFGGGFTTTLDLRYGHAPGDYIPTVLDVIGKMLYNNRDIAGYTIQRQANSGNENNLGVVLMSPSGGSSLASDNSSPPTTFSSFNNQVINNILYTAAYIINANNTKGNNVTATVELRMYFDNSTGGADGSLFSFAQQVQSALTGSSGTSSGVKSPSFPSNAVTVVPINLDDATDRRSPSQKAMDAARNQVSANSTTVSSSSSLSPGVDVIKKSLFSYIVDCWLIFTQSSGT